MAENTSLLQIFVTEEQRELIYAMWNHNDWEVQLCEATANEIGKESSYLTFIERRQGSDTDYCDFCLCSPCITNSRYKQHWWEDENHLPNSRNNLERKKLYYKFWVMLLHRGVWDLPIYLERKNASLENPNSVWCGPRLHKRDIMPHCVVKLVRTWWPNEAGTDYMGHRWQ